MPNNINIVRDQFRGRTNKKALITFNKPIQGCTVGMDYIFGRHNRNNKGDRENNRKTKF